MFNQFKNLKSILFSFIFLFAFSTANAGPLQELFHQPNDPVAGNPKGDITIVEFFDYQCSYCASMAPIIESIIHDNPNVRVVLKEYPIRGALSVYASRAALAANKQGKEKYYQFNRALLESSEELTRATIMAAAKKVGLNTEKLQKDMDSDAVTNELKANFELAQDLNINGTPVFFIGKTNAQSKSDVEFIVGAMTKNEMQKAIDNSK